MSADKESVTYLLRRIEDLEAERETMRDGLGNLAKKLTAAETRESGLREALAHVRTLTGCYDCMVAENDICDRCREVRSTVDAALAAPGTKAAEVLIAAKVVRDTYYSGDPDRREMWVAIGDLCSKVAEWQKADNEVE